MKVYIYTGVHGTGKTTRMLQDVVEFKKANPSLNVGLVPELARMVDCNSLDREGLIRELYEFFYSKLNNFDVVFSDRCSLDTFAYMILKDKYNEMQDYDQDIKSAIDTFANDLPRNTEIEIRFFHLKNADPAYNVKEDKGRGSTLLHDSDEERDALEYYLKYVYVKLDKLENIVDYNASPLN